MDSGRKRIPLGVVSPSAVRNAQRRRPSHDVQTSGNVPSANRENLEPNRASASLPESSFQSPARNDNFVQQPSHSTLGSCTGFQDRLGAQSPTRITQKGFIGSSQASALLLLLQFKF
ncbi:uncharacterized protein LOC135146706 isoform X2 [Daucus carota subsp. sativus]|uniref:uncharacterized protein LOC135146706 isoform X2 n=1 Tax=Daucus carota subsp. sativus TaxID=79200 RepID=UPI0030827DCE